MARGRQATIKSWETNGAASSPAGAPIAVANMINHSVGSASTHGGHLATGAAALSTDPRPSLIDYVTPRARCGLLFLPRSHPTATFGRDCQNRTLFVLNKMLRWSSVPQDLINNPDGSLCIVIIIRGHKAKIKRDRLRPKP